MTRRRSWRALPAVVVAVLACLLCSTLASCNLRLTAQQVRVTMTKTGMAVVTPKSHQIRTGEVVITVENYTGSKRQPVLLRTKLTVDQLPQSLVSAPAESTDSAVVMIGGVMEKAKAEIIGFLPVTEPSTAKLHVFLRAGEHYLLFDALGGQPEQMNLSVVPHGS